MLSCLKSYSKARLFKRVWYWPKENKYVGMKNRRGNLDLSPHLISILIWYKNSLYFAKRKLICMQKCGVEYLDIHINKKLKQKLNLYLT